MDRQSDRNGEYPAQVLDKLCFSIPCIDIHVQCSHHKIVEESSDRAHPDDQYGPPQSISAGQIIGSVEHSRIRRLNRNASEQPITGSHQDTSDRTKYTPSDKLLISFCLHSVRLQLQFMISSHPGHRGRL